MTPSDAPLVVGIGGTARQGSTSDRALRLALDAAERSGARTITFGGPFLAELPHYRPGSDERSPDVRELIDAVRAADGLILASPGYHGGVSGVVKNALDFIEDLREDERPYWHDRAVGCIVVAHGWQACGSTLAALRAIVHALRGWPTPLGATLNTAERIFDADGRCVDEHAAGQLELVGQQVLAFALGMSPVRS